MLINSICLCRVFILFPLSRLPAYNHGLTLGPGYALEEKGKKDKVNRAVRQSGKGNGKKCSPQPPPAPTSAVQPTALLADFFCCSSATISMLVTSIILVMQQNVPPWRRMVCQLQVHPISYPESSGLLVSGGTQGHRQDTGSDGSTPPPPTLSTPCKG